jgi:biotin carboxyl carrier protein
MMIEGFVEPVNTTSIVLPPCDGTILFLVEDGTYVEEGEVICIIEWQSLQGQYDQILISLETAEVGLIRTKADLNMQLAILEAQVRTNDADTRMAQMDSARIAFMSVNDRLIKELELERASIEKARYEKRLEALKVIQQSDIRRIELEIARFKINIDRTKEQLDALTIKAPHSGLIIRNINWDTGTKLNILMVEAGYLKNTDGIKLPTYSGQVIGITTVTRHSSRGEYVQCLFGADAQRVCLDLVWREVEGE